MTNADYTSARNLRLQAIAPVATVALLFGISFGAVATTAGFGLEPALVMSATTFAGSAQIGAASVLAAGGGALGAVLAGVLLNLRYLPMGVTAAGAYRGPWWSRVAQAQLLGDETWALSRTPDGGHDRKLLLQAGAAVYVVWAAGTALGVVVFRGVGDISAWGLDMVSPAIFFALLWKQLDSPRTRIAALAAVAVALALTPVTPAGVPIAVASLVCLMGLLK